MARVSGATLVGKALINEGVKAAFTLCGGLSGIYDTCDNGGIELIGMRHEQAVANAATGYAQVAGKPGVAMVTSGPGVINMASGMAAAMNTHTPVIGICCHALYCFEGMGVLQEFDSKDMYRPITKWVGYCTSTRRIPDYMAKAFRYADSGRKGPVLVDIADDALMLDVDEEQVPIIPPDSYRTTSRPYGEPELVRQATKWLMEAERPAILVGTGVLRADASEELVKFAELLNIPVCCAIGGKGAIPDDHPLCGGPIGYSFGSIAGADVLLAIGVRFEDVLGFGKGDLYAPDVRVISVDIEPTEIGRNRPIAMGIYGDAKAVLSQLIESANASLGGGKRGETEWLKTVRSIAQTVNETLTSDMPSTKKPIDPRWLGKEVCDFLGTDSYIVMDGGDINAQVTPLYNASFPGSFLSALGGSLGHLGGGIPFAIGVKTADLDKKVLVIEGDGSFLLNGSEIDTAVRHNKQIVVVISNDCQWGMVRHSQQLHEHKDLCSKLSEAVRYDKYAESLGAYGELVTEPDQIKPALQRAFDSGLPAVLDVRTNPDVMCFADYLGLDMKEQIQALYEK